MREEIIEGVPESTLVWEGLEELVRGKVQQFIQEILEEEVTELLGRRKSQRRMGIDASPGSRNGYGKPRKLTMSCGTITVRRPRVRDLEERFESRLLPLFVRRSRQVSELIPELYLHGLAEGDFDLALRGLLGEEAALSASTVARLKDKWQSEYESWSQRSLEGLQAVYVWVDGVYVKAGLEKDKAALLVVMAALADGRKEVISLVAGYRESEKTWSAVLRDLRRRGLVCPKLVIGDGHLGIWAALRNVYPELKEQRCWNHRILNIMAQVPKRFEVEARRQICAIPYAPTRQECEKRKKEFQHWCRSRQLDAAADRLDDDWDRMVTFYEFPKEHWTHIRTTNVIESPFAALRLRTDAARRYKKVPRATAVIFKSMMVAEKKFRRLNSPELLEEIFYGRGYARAEPITQQSAEAAA